MADKKPKPKDIDLKSLIAMILNQRAAQSDRTGVAPTGMALAAMQADRTIANPRLNENQRALLEGIKNTYGPEVATRVVVDKPSFSQGGMYERQGYLGTINQMLEKIMDPHPDSFAPQIRIGSPDDDFLKHYPDKADQQTYVLAHEFGHLLPRRASADVSQYNKLNSQGLADAIGHLLMDKTTPGKKHVLPHTMGIGQFLFGDIGPPGRRNTPEHDVRADSILSALEQRFSQRFMPNPSPPATPRPFTIPAFNPSEPVPGLDKQLRLAERMSAIGR